MTEWSILTAKKKKKKRHFAYKSLVFTKNLFMSCLIINVLNIYSYNAHITCICYTLKSISMKPINRCLFCILLLCVHRTRRHTTTYWTSFPWSSAVHWRHACLVTSSLCFRKGTSSESAQTHSRYLRGTWYLWSYYCNW